MDRVKIEIENCYGINLLKDELDFSKKRANIIYAPNGSMKTSFARTFKDISDGVDSKDRIYKDRASKRIITDQSGNELTKESMTPPMRPVHL